MELIGAMALAAPRHSPAEGVFVRLFLRTGQLQPAGHHGRVAAGHAFDLLGDAARADQAPPPGRGVFQVQNPRAGVEHVVRVQRNEPLAFVVEPDVRRRRGELRDLAADAAIDLADAPTVDVFALSSCATFSEMFLYLLLFRMIGRLPR